MIHNKIVSLVLVIAFLSVSCHSVKVDKSTMKTATKNPIALGVIGQQKEHVTNATFAGAAIPNYQEHIRVKGTSTDFSQATFNAYLNASKENPYQIQYVDSLESKPAFVTLQVVDKVSLIEALKEDHNKEALRYIENQKKATMVTSVSIAGSEAILQELEKAEAIFLHSSAYKQYQLSLVKDGQRYKTIDFGEVTIFAYDLSFFCWGENDKKKLELKDIVDTRHSCSGKTYRDAEKVKKKINYFKL